MRVSKLGDSESVSKCRAAEAVASAEINAQSQLGAHLVDGQ